MKGKFTLIEVLVVLAVVSFLVAIFVPVVSASSGSAKRAQCINNLRKITALALSYQIEHATVMPASFGNTNAGFVNHWINYLIQQGANPKLFRCPAMREDAFFDPAGHDPTTGNIHTEASYIMNIIGLGRWNGATLNSTKSTSCGWGISSTMPIRMPQVKKPSQTIYIVDVIEDIASSHSGINDFRRTDHGIKATVNVAGFVRWVGTHHEGGFNAAFGDGHVEMLDSTQHDDWVAVPDY